MKPTHMFETATTPKDSVETETRRTRLSRKMVYLLIGVVAFVLVVSTVLLSVHFGMKMAKDNYKEYQATLVGDDGVVVQEKVIVTDTEEVFSNDLATGIIDFSTGLLTIKIEKSEFPNNECYVANVNLSDFQTPNEFTSIHATSQITFETKNMTTRSYDVIGVRLNIKALGPRSAKLCRGKDVYFLHEKTGVNGSTRRHGKPSVSD